IAAAFEDLPAKLFEEEAKPYLVLVPEEQAIGLYLAFGFGKGSFQNFTPRILPGPSTFVTLGDNAPHFVTAGIGVRYFPKRWFLVDLAWLPAALKWDISSDFTSGATEAKNTHFMTGESFTLSANLVQPLATSLRAFAGLGGALYSVGFENGTQSGLGASDRELSTKQGGRGAKFSTLRPFLRLGTEWKLQSRIGWAVFGDLFPFQSKRTIYVHDPAPGSSTEGLSEPVLEMKFPTVIFNTTLSLYF
ncbi:MAG: hypothetical protein HY400_04640, partial [Elusimicrobia bacterium]|nr:hypothetical protein [Elusimicrobiota bacterium]